MFLLVSVRHVGAHPGEHQHGVSIQISINLGKTFLRISRIRNILLTWILARVFVYVPPFISHILDFIYWTVLILILVYFEWRDTENQQFAIFLKAKTLLTYTSEYWNCFLPSFAMDRKDGQGLRLENWAGPTLSRFTECYAFGIQNTADTQGGGQQQHLLTSYRVTAVFRGRIVQLSWPTDGNETDL